MKRLSLVAAMLVLFSMPSFAADPVFRINVGQDYNRYSNEELRRRVYDLERAVYQMQQRIYNLETAPVQPIVVAPPLEKPWTCSLLDNFGGMHMSTSQTRTQAEALTMQDCVKEKDAMFCKAEKMKCGQ